MDPFHFLYFLIFGMDSRLEFVFPVNFLIIEFSAKFLQVLLTFFKILFQAFFFLFGALFKMIEVND